MNLLDNNKLSLSLKSKVAIGLCTVAVIGLVGSELVFSSTGKGKDKVTPIPVTVSTPDKAPEKTSDKTQDRSASFANEGQGRRPLRNIFDPWWQDSLMAHDPEIGSMFRRWESLAADSDLLPDRVFSRNSGTSFASGFAPRVDISESDKDVKLTAEVPGLDEKSLSVSAADDSVTIEGTKTQEKSSKAGGFQSVERTYGSFRRVVPLPCQVLGDKAEAGLKDGVLTITIPKSPQARPRENKITITRL